MTTIYLVSCVSKKENRAVPARDLYTSDWFRKVKAFVEATGEPWYILSAQHGLLHPDTVTAPYEKTLNRMPVAQRRSWANQVIDQMESMLPKADKVVLLAGQRYRENLLDYLRTRGRIVEIPLEGLRIGEQLSWLKRNTRGG